MKWLGKTILFALLWVTVIVIALSVLSSAMRIRAMDFPNNVSSKIEGFYALEPDSLDVVFLGTSATFFGINPSLLWREYGIPAYVFASSEQPIFFNYLYAQEAIRTQHPGIIVLDTHGIRYTYDYARSATNHLSLDDLPMSLNKLKAIFCYTPPEEWLEHLFPVIKYHSALNISTCNFGAAQEDPYLGYTPYWTCDVENDFQFQNRGVSRRALAEREEVAFRKLIELCRQEGVQLILANYPAALSSEDNERISEIIYIAETEGIPYLDMDNQTWTEENDYVATRDCQYVGHSNYLGAAKITRAIGAILSEQYNLPDHRGDNAYTSWEDKTGHYYQLEHLQTNPLKTQLYIKDYLAEVAYYNQDGYAIVMSANDEASYEADEEIDALLEALGWQHPISKDFRASHLFISVDGDVVVSEMDTEYAIYAAYEDFKHHSVITAWSVGYEHPIRPEIASAEDATSTFGAIYIQDTSIIPSRGLTIVVYDLVQQTIIDSAVFDLYTTQYRNLSGDEQQYPSPNPIADTAQDYNALAACTNAVDYFRELASMPYMIAITANDDASSAMSDEIVQSMHALGLNMSLMEQYRTSYIAVCQDGRAYYESLGGLSQRHSVTVDESFLLLESAAYGATDIQTCISINGKSYPATGRGLYIIVYDNVHHLIVDRVTLDTCDGVSIYR